MFKYIKGETFRDAYYKCFEELQSAPIVDSRLGPVKEIHPCMVEIEKPEWRCILAPYRGNNPFATIFETIWVLAGSSRIKDQLDKYLPRAKDYSDDGIYWKSGYGPRIRNWRQSGIDQIAYVVDELKKSPESRRAIISLWDPTEECTVGESLDFPCSNHLQFMVRDGALDCELTIRSNDLIYGMGGINIFEFTVLQQLIASALDFPVGKYFHSIGSLHIYEKHWEKADKILDNYCITPQLYPFDFCCNEEFLLDKYKWVNFLSIILNVEKYSLLSILDSFDYEWQTEIMLFLKAYKVGEKCNFDLNHRKFAEAYCDMLNNARNTDLKAECVFWLEKKAGRFLSDELFECLNKQGFDVKTDES